MPLESKDDELVKNPLLALVVTRYSQAEGVQERSRAPFRLYLRLMLNVDSRNVMTHFDGKQQKWCVGFYVT